MEADPAGYEYIKQAERLDELKKEYEVVQKNADDIAAKRQALEDKRIKDEEGAAAVQLERDLEK